MNILQSLHGLIPVPVPCLGFFRILKYSERRGSFFMSNVTSVMFFGGSMDLQAEQPKGRMKWIAVIWKPCSWSRRMTNLESSPPEYKTKACFGFGGLAFWGFGVLAGIVREGEVGF